MEDERELGEPYPIANEIPLETTPNIQTPPAQMPEVVGGEQAALGGEPNPIPMQPEPRAGIDSIGLSPKVKADIVENTIESNPKQAADVLPNDGPLSDLNKEAEQAIDGGKDAEVRNDVVEKSLDDLDFEAFIDSVENGTNVNNKLDSLVNDLHIKDDPALKENIKNKAINSFKTGYSNNLGDLADYLENNVDNMSPDEYGEFVEHAADLIGYTLKDDDKKTEAQIERFNDDPDLLIDRLRWASKWASVKDNATNTDELQSLLDKGAISEEDLAKAVYDVSKEERRDQVNEDAKKWAGEQILKTRQGLLQPINYDAAKKEYEERSDAAARLYGFTEDIPLTKEEKKALEEENKRKNAEEKEEFRQASNEALINTRNHFNKFYEDFDNEKWKKKLDNLVLVMDQDFREQDQIDRKQNFIENPFEDTLTDVGMLEQELEDDIELDEEEKKKVKDELEWVKLQFGKGAPIDSVKSGDLNDEFEMNKKASSAGSSFKGFKPVIGSGMGHSIARGTPLSSKSSKSAVQSTNNSGAAKVANDVTARKDYKPSSLIKGTSNSVKRNDVNTRNGSFMSSGVSKTKGGRLLGVKGSKLPNGGGHTSAGTGKMDLPKAGGKLSKTSQNLTLASLKARIIGASQSWPEKNGFKDSEDRLGSIQLLVKDTEVWVASGVTKGRIKLENALKKEPQLAQLIRAEL